MDQVYCQKLHRGSPDVGNTTGQHPSLPRRPTKQSMCFNQTTKPNNQTTTDHISKQRWSKTTKRKTSGKRKIESMTESQSTPAQAVHPSPSTELKAASMSGNCPLLSVYPGYAAMPVAQVVKCKGPLWTWTSGGKGHPLVPKEVSCM